MNEGEEDHLHTKRETLKCERIDDMKNLDWGIKRDIAPLKELRQAFNDDKNFYNMISEQAIKQRREERKVLAKAPKELQQQQPEQLLD